MAGVIQSAKEDNNGLKGRNDEKAVKKKQLNESERKEEGKEKVMRQTTSRGGRCKVGM